MTIPEFATLLETTGFSAAKDEFPLEVNPGPIYIVYEILETNNFVADNVVYHTSYILAVSLYTKGHSDSAAMKTLTDVFDANDIPWKLEAEYDYEGYDYQTVYTVQIL